MAALFFSWCAASRKRKVRSGGQRAGEARWRVEWYYRSIILQFGVIAGATTASGRRAIGIGDAVGRSAERSKGVRALTRGLSRLTAVACRSFPAVRRFRKRKRSEPKRRSHRHDYDFRSTSHDIL